MSVFSNEKSLANRDNQGKTFKVYASRKDASPITQRG